MVALFVVFIIFFVAVLVMMVVAGVRRYRAAKNAGLDPFAGDIQLMGAARNSALLAPAAPSADAVDPKARLGRLDALLADGTITQEEYRSARQRILDQL
jgi:ParB-like chromosome segregation protein Spo0J